MRDLTKAELEDYFRFARADKGAPDFHLDQTQLVGEVLVRSGLLEMIGMVMAHAQLIGFEAADAALSLWVSAFQMGRECESRLITMALKGRQEY